MHIVITGGAGFLGDLLASELIKRFREIRSLTLVDIKDTHQLSVDDERVTYLCANLTQEHALDSIISDETTHVFHLAAIVSSHAEAEFDLGMQINVKVTERLLEHCRATNPNIRFIFTSSLAVFGGQLPNLITPQTAVQPSSSYGTQKAICELLVNDYARKRFLDAMTLRLPTICIRPGLPNLAASSFVSGLIREPLNQTQTNCPVDVDLPLWVSSPETVIHNFMHALQLDSNKIQGFRCINLPGIQTSPREMLLALEHLTDSKSQSYISFEKIPAIEAIVSSWPKEIDNTQALSLGFIKDKDFKAVLLNYVQKHHPKLKEY